MPYPVVHQRGRRKVRNPLPTEIVDQIRNEKVYLINVSAQEWLLNRTHGVYIIRAVDEGREYSVCEITGRIEMMDQGDENYLQQMTRAQDIALDLAASCNDSIITVSDKPSFAGVFISKSPKPTREELQKQQARVMEFYGDQVAEGDRMWNDPHEHKNINSLMRRAAKALGLKKPWVYDSVQQFVTCPACGESILPSVAICKTCGAIQPGKEAEARKFFPERFSGDTPEADKQPRQPRQQRAATE